MWGNEILMAEADGVKQAVSQAVLLFVPSGNHGGTMLFSLYSVLMVSGMSPSLMGR